MRGGTRIDRGRWIIARGSCGQGVSLAFRKPPVPWPTRVRARAPAPLCSCTCTRDTRLYAPRASTYVCVYVPACVRACVYRASEGERREAAEEFTAACELRESVALDSRIAISVKVSTSCFHVYNDPVISYSIVVIYTCCIPGEETEFRACEA